MVKMEMTDIPEAKHLHTMNTGIWYSKTVIFLMFDVTDETSFLKGVGYNGGVKYWLEELRTINRN